MLTILSCRCSDLFGGLRSALLAFHVNDHCNKSERCNEEQERDEGVDTEHQRKATALVQQRNHADCGASADEQQEIAHGIDAAATCVSGVEGLDHVVNSTLPVTRVYRACSRQQ